MRTFLISIAAAASTIALAAPASAQWVVPTYNHQPYNYGYGYNGYNFARAMQQRVQRIRYDIRAMANQRILSFREARALEREAIAVERRIVRAPRNGVRPAEARGIENRIRRLEIRIARDARDWDRRPDRRRY